MEKYWLFLYPDTFLFCESKKAFICNSISGKGFKVYRKENTSSIINELSEIDNLYCVEISQDKLEKHDVKSFVSKLIETFSGNLMQKNTNDPKPTILPPVLNLQKDIERLRKDKFRSTGENISSYLNEINIYLDTIKVNRDNKCQKRPKTILEFEPLKRFISKLNNNSLNKINLYSNGYLELNYLLPLIDKLFEYSFTVILNVPVYSKIDFNGIYHPYWPKEFKVRFVTEPDFIVEEVSNIINTIERNTIKKEFLFLVSSMNDFLKANRIVKKNKELNIEIRPLYKNGNLDFFEENIYLTEREFTKLQITKQKIFLRQVINTNDFGKLTITADGNVHANPNFPALGTIEDDIRELVYKEMEQGTSWRRVRNMKPCSCCMYQWLCPSPSDYELAIGKPNLCHVKP